MKAIFLVAAAIATAAGSFAQVYSVGKHRERIQQAQGQARPARQQPVPIAPAGGAGVGGGAAVSGTKPASPAKVAAGQALKDQKQFEFFKRRAEEGSDHGQYETGLRYLTGRGVAVDVKAGREWLEKAAKAGHVQAAKKLAELDAAGISKGAPAVVPTPRVAKPNEVK